MRKYLYLIVSFVLAAGAGLAVWFFISANIPSVNVVVTTVKIPAGATIMENQITTKLVAKSVLPPGALTNPAAAVGKVMNYAVLDEEVLRQEHVATSGSSLVARLTVVAPGKVAVDLPLEAAQGLNGLGVGDRVNIYGEAAVNAGGQVASAIEKVADRATILYAPPAGAREKNAIIIACSPAEEQQLAQVLSHNKKVTLFLQPGGGGL